MSKTRKEKIAQQFLGINKLILQLKRREVMKIITSLITFITVLFLLLPLQVSSAVEEVYGWNMMTEQERIQHRETMSNLKTNKERERYQTEHHNKMMERAKERGLSMPDMPMHQGPGMPMRDGKGMGSGGGMGRGR